MKEMKIAHVDPETWRVLKTDIATEVLLIQCKNLKVEKPLSKLEKHNLLKLAKQTGAKALHIFNRNHKLVIEELN